MLQCGTQTAPSDWRMRRSWFHGVQHLRPRVECRHDYHCSLDRLFARMAGSPSTNSKYLAIHNRKGKLHIVALYIYNSGTVAQHGLVL